MTFKTLGDTYRQLLYESDQDAGKCADCKPGAPCAAVDGGSALSQDGWCQGCGRHIQELMAQEQAPST